MRVAFDGTLVDRDDKRASSPVSPDVASDVVSDVASDMASEFD